MEQQTLITNTTTFNCHDKEVIMQGYEGEYIFNKIATTKNFYEIEMLNFIRDLKLSGTVLDVGANMGNHSVFLGLMCDFEEVIAIEPFDVVRRLLVENIKQNGLEDKTTILAKAVDAASGEVVVIPATAENFGKTKTGVHHGSGPVVPAVTLDEIGKDKNIGLIKIDIEGYELNALRGATDILKNQRPALFIEAYSAIEKDPIDAFLASYGYRSKDRFGITATYFYTTEE